MKYLIGIDIGTTGTKSAIFDTDGMLLGEAYRESTLHYPKPGWVEQDPDEFYSLTCDTIREIMDKTEIDPRDVAAICIDGQMAGVLGIDNDWKPVTHYDSWLDNRCEKYVEYIQDSYGDKVLELSGLPSTVAHCAKILWWKHEEPDIYERIEKFIQPAAYVSGRMVGLKGKDAFIDYTYLHFTGLYDSRNTEWSAELCDKFEISIDKLPEIVEPWKVIGRLTDEVARECGLTTAVSVVAGAGDQAAGFLGAGLVEPGLVVDVAGTASVFACCVDEYRPDLMHKTLLFPKAVSDGLWFPHAYIGGGGLCLRWFRDSIVQPDEEALGSMYDVLNNEAEDIPPASDGLMFVPHLGGRNYPYDSNIRGTWTGFSWGHKRKHFYRSIMEAIAYEYYSYLKIEKSLFPEVEFKEVRVIGGGSKSMLFNQIKANVLGIPYVQLDRDEVGVLGSAIIAGFGVGIFDDLNETAKKFINTRNRIEPDMELHEYYRNYADLYMDMISTIKPIYKRLAELSALLVPQK